MTEEIDTWFNSWERLLSVGIGAVFFFIVIVLMVRLLGKRTTSQMNNFDWIITVAVGSLAAGGILLKGVSIADATFAILLLAGLQWLTTWLVIRFPSFSRTVKATPTLLVHKGEFLEDAMLRERITKSEIMAKLRGAGCLSVEDANWVVLETNGSLSYTPIDNTTWEVVSKKIMSDVDAPDSL